MREPLVSICLITYMHERYIEDCIKSLLYQNYKNIEILILDDCSDDQTFRIIESYREKLKSRFQRTVIQKNKYNCGNISANLNFLIKQSKGEYIKTFAGDDIMLPDCISASVAYLERDKESIMCYANAYIIQDSFHLGDQPERNYYYKRHKSCRQEELFEQLLKSCNITASTAVIRKHAFDKYGLYDEDIKFEDYDFWLRLSKEEKFAYLPLKLVYYRRAETSLTNFKSPQGRQKLVFMFKEEKKVYQKNLKNIYSKKKQIYKECYYNKFLWRAINAGFFDMAAQLAFFMVRKQYKIDWKKVNDALKSSFFWKGKLR